MRTLTFFLVGENVATPFLEECENDIHTLEMGTWESSGTPETSEFDCKGQNISLWGTPYISEFTFEHILCDSHFSDIDSHV